MITLGKQFNKPTLAPSYKFASRFTTNDQLFKQLQQIFIYIN